MSRRGRGAVDGVIGMVAVLALCSGGCLLSSGVFKEATGGDTQAVPAADGKKSATLSSEEMASIAAARGYPPKPDAATQARYIAALTAIDPDIVHGKPDKAVSRGRNHCGSIRRLKNRPDELTELAILRFTSPSHPEGFGAAKARQITEVVHKHLCPDF